MIRQDAEFSQCSRGRDFINFLVKEQPPRSYDSEFDLISHDGRLLIKHVWGNTSSLPRLSLSYCAAIFLAFSTACSMVPTM